MSNKRAGSGTGARPYQLQYEYSSLVRAIIETEAMAQTEYVALTDTETLDPVSVISGSTPVLLSLAARIGPIRLTDNIVLNGDL